MAVRQPNFTKEGLIPEKGFSNDCFIDLDFANSQLLCLFNSLKKDIEKIFKKFTSDATFYRPHREETKRQLIQKAGADCTDSLKKLFSKELKEKFVRCELAIRSFYKKKSQPTSAFRGIKFSNTPPGGESSIINYNFLCSEILISFVNEKYPVKDVYGKEIKDQKNMSPGYCSTGLNGKPINTKRKKVFDVIEDIDKVLKEQDSKLDKLRVDMTKNGNPISNFIDSINNRLLTETHSPSVGGKSSSTFATFPYNELTQYATFLESAADINNTDKNKSIKLAIPKIEEKLNNYAKINEGIIDACKEHKNENKTLIEIENNLTRNKKGFEEFIKEMSSLITYSSYQSKIAKEVTEMKKSLENCKMSISNLISESKSKINNYLLTGNLPRWEEYCTEFVVNLEGLSTCTCIVYSKIDNNVLIPPPAEKVSYKDTPEYSLNIIFSTINRWLNGVETQLLNSINDAKYIAEHPDYAEEIAKKGLTKDNMLSTALFFGFGSAFSIPIAILLAIGKNLYMGIDTFFKMRKENNEFKKALEKIEKNMYD